MILLQSRRGYGVLGANVRHLGTVFKIRATIFFQGSQVAWHHQKSAHLGPVNGATHQNPFSPCIAALLCFPPRSVQPKRINKKPSSFGQIPTTPACLPAFQLPPATTDGLPAHHRPAMDAPPLRNTRVACLPRMTSSGLGPRPPEATFALPMPKSRIRPDSRSKMHPWTCSPRSRIAS